MSSEEKDNIKVTDKRKFDSEGNPLPRSEEPKQAEAKSEPELAETASGLGDEAAEQAGGHGIGREENLPPVEFTTFILGLGTQAMMFLGMFPDPVTNQVKKSLPMASQMIEILTMLREKTKGNLEAGEITTIDNLLYNLRMSFVEISKQDSQE